MYGSLRRSERVSNARTVLHQCKTTSSHQGSLRIALRACLVFLRFQPMDTSNMQLREAYLKNPDGDKLPCILAGNCILPLGDIFENTPPVKYSTFRKLWKRVTWGAIPLTRIPEGIRVHNGKLFSINGQLKASLFNEESGEKTCPFFVTSV